MKDAEYIKQRISDNHEKLLDLRGRLENIEFALREAGFPRFQPRHVLEKAFEENQSG